MADDVREEDEWLYGESESLVTLKREVAVEEEDDEQSRGSQPVGGDGEPFDGGQEERGSGATEKEVDSDNVNVDHGETEAGGGGDGEVSFSLVLIASEIQMSNLLKTVLLKCRLMILDYWVKL